MNLRRPPTLLRSQQLNSQVKEPAGRDRDICYRYRSCCRRRKRSTPPLPASLHEDDDDDDDQEEGLTTIIIRNDQMAASVDN